MIDKPDLSMFDTFELTDLLIACAQSDDPSDKEFAAYCRDEIKKRKPSPDDINYSGGNES